MALLIWQVLPDALIAIGSAINHFWPPLALSSGRCGFTDTTPRRLEVLSQDGKSVELRAAIPGVGRLPEADLLPFDVPRPEHFSHNPGLNWRPNEYFSSLRPQTRSGFRLSALTSVPAAAIAEALANKTLKRSPSERPRLAQSQNGFVLFRICLGAGEIIESSIGDADDFFANKF